jgi:hypothetical protein
MLTLFRRLFNRLNTRVLVAAVTILVLAVVTMVVAGETLKKSPTPVAAAVPEQRPRAFVEVNGVRSAISVGDVILPPTPKVDGKCNLPPLKLIGEADSSVTSGRIGVDIRGNCSVVVTNISFGNDPPPPSRPNGYDVKEVPPEVKPLNGPRSQAPTVHPRSSGFARLPFAPSVVEASHITTHYRGYARSNLEDPINIPLTYTLAVMSYYDNGVEVWGGHDPINQCGWFPDGWRNLWCSAAWWPYGTSSVYTNTEGQFDHSLISGSQHWQKAQFDAWPDTFWNYTCWHTGNPPGPVHWACYGNRVTI